MAKAITKKVKKGETAASWRALIEEMGEKQTKGGHSYKQSVIRALYKAAAKSEPWAVQELLNRTLGKAVSYQQTDLTSGGESLSASVNFVGNTLNSGAEQPLKAIDPIVDQVVDVTKESTSD